MSTFLTNVQILFTSSKSIKPTQTEAIKIGKYKLRAVPTARASLTDSTENILLEFNDEWDADQKFSNPEEEGNIVLSFLSLIFQARIEHVASRLNTVQITAKRAHSAYLNGEIVLPPNTEKLLKKLLSMDMDLLRQYMRSCNAYKTALSLIGENPTLSFFLLVTAIEAISGKVIKKTERVNFVEFILNYLPKPVKDDIPDEKLLRTLIKEAYAMRCAFTHGGHRLSIGSLLADKSDLPFVAHYVDNKRIYSPSLKWFEKVVRYALVSFLEKQKIKKAEEKKFPNLPEKNLWQFYK